MKVLAPVQIRYITQKEAVAQRVEQGQESPVSVVRIHSLPQKYGAVAETVEKSYSAWSEKPETPVRIRSVPLNW